jgi:hypothetical protein
VLDKQDDKDEHVLALYDGRVVRWGVFQQITLLYVVVCGSELIDAVPRISVLAYRLS